MKPIEEVLENMKRLNQENRSTTPQPLLTGYGNRFECPLCQDRGIVLEDGPFGLPVGKQCSCIEQKAIKRLIMNSGMTDEQRKYRLEDFKPTPKTKGMYELVKRYLDKIPDILNQGTYSKGLALIGNYGIGKTTLVCVIANKFIENRVPVIYAVTPDLMGELKAAMFSKDPMELENKIQKLSTTEVVIFDDVAREHITERVKEQYFRIIDYRYRNRLTTIFTSNYPFEELEDEGLLGEAISSRLAQMTRDFAIQVKADNYRLNGG